MSTATAWRIRGGHVIDPANGIDAVCDLWIDGGRIVEPPTDPDARATRTLDARGYVVMPAGVDVHCHIAGSKVNAARLFQPEMSRAGQPSERRPGFRSGTNGPVPTTFSTGYKYAGLGYTFACDAAIAPMGARHAHHELEDTPAIDKAFLVLAGNNHLVMDRVREDRPDSVRDVIAWLVNATRAYGIKVVDPGGVEAWKQARGLMTALDDVVPRFDVTPRAILTGVARAVDELKLPHPMHVHGLNLGLPGNAASTLELMNALDGHRAHLAHIQFHSYAGSAGDTSSMASGVAALVEVVNASRTLTLDVGQVVFGATTSLTGDSPVGQFLHTVTGRKWISHDIEQETGCGVVPITYEDKNFVHALQWAIGMEWFLRVDDPWKIALSTDHPNGGSFLAYPQIIAWLMNRNLREQTLAGLPEKARAGTVLGELGREYSLSEIAIITRAAPARMLGLTDRGHLGIGAMADITIYAPDDDRTRMFAMPRWVIKSGALIVEDGEPRTATEGHTLHNAPGYDPAVIPEIREAFDRHSSIQFANFAIEEETP